MKAEAVNLLRFFQIGKQCLIPIYQRTYSWTEDQCESLWNDIVRVGTNESIPNHFVGSFVYIQDSGNVLSATPQCMVIDGQQRMTTISLLLMALTKVVDEKGGELVLEDDYKINSNYIRDTYLLNSLEMGDRRFKLILTQSDKETYLALLQNLPLPPDYSKRIKENYDWFEDKLQDSDLKEVFRGIQKLMIVEIALDRTNDNPQLIFESLNSTGLELSQADLIRNYILMGLEPKRQTRLYNEFWYPMERSFGHSEYSSYFDRFMRDYLTLRLGRIPNITDVHREFKDHSQNGEYEDIESLVADVSKYSGYFVNMVLDKESDEKLSKNFSNINQLKVDVVYPLLLEVYSDYKKEVINKDDFIQIVLLLEGYIFRRAICGIPTNSMNKTFANFYKEIDQADYLNSFKAALLLKDSYRRFPTDDEFKRELIYKDVYNFRNKNYLLEKLENSHHSKEIIDLSQFSIEHILPQNENLSPEWRADLGQGWKEIQSKYLHTLGNLTLTGYNSELSDRPFTQKRDIAGGFRASPLFLNSYLKDLNAWTEETLLIRANSLADLAVQVWAYPSLDEAILEKYRQAKTERKAVSEYSVADFKHLNGGNLDLFNQVRTQILTIDPSILEEFKKFYIAYKTDGNIACIVPQKTRLRITLHIPVEDLDDPKGICMDVRGKGRWGGGSTQFGLYTADELEYAMLLIKQSYEYSLSE